MPMVMKLNASNGRLPQDPVQQAPPKPSFRPFKGLRSRSRSNGVSNNGVASDDGSDHSSRGIRFLTGRRQQNSSQTSLNNSQSRASVDDLDVTSSPRRRNVQEFLPNPEIPASPASATPTRKTWEGAYSTFLSKRSRASGSSTTCSSNSSSPANFMVVPGSKRLLVRNHHAPDVLPTIHSVPNSSTSSSRVQSMSDLGISSKSDRQQKGPVLRQSVFGRSVSDGSVSLQQRRRKNTSMDADELDSAMRNGMHKDSSHELSQAHYHHHEEPHAPQHRPHAFSNGDRCISQEHIPDGLDDLLAGASSSPHLSVDLVSFPRSSSSYAAMYAMASTPESEQLSFQDAPPFPHRQSSGSLNHHQMGLSLDDEGSPHSNSFSNGFPFAPRPTPAEGGLGSLLAAHDEQLTNMPPITPALPTMRSSHTSGDRPSMSQGEIGELLVDEGETDLDAVLQDAAFSVNSSLSGSQQTVDPEMKKAFTNFHNQPRFASDSTSAFLGTDGMNSSPRNFYAVYQMAMVGGGSSAIPKQVFSQMDLTRAAMANTISNGPLDENNLSVHKDLLLLKPMQGTESWESGRRYLIAPAALAACPLQTVNRLSSHLSMLSPDTLANGTFDPFQPISFGMCLMTYVGDKHHLSLGKWSSCQLVLRQNYLMEFAESSSLNGLPRGFINLQHATAYAQPDFLDSLELDFYASPCARTDRRVLRIRVKNRTMRDHCIACLNKAAGLRIDDIWDFDQNVEYGRGRYAAVFPARRKTLTKKESSASSVYQDEYECALKIIDKNEFWRRVVKGKERADTLVREVAVQSTLTAKCSEIPSFLQLRGYFETSDNVVMELELLEGTDLFRYISAKGVLSEEEAARIIQDVLRSLDAMHRVGLVHRDVKPANVLMCDSEHHQTTVKVGDFGMSTFVGVDGLVRGRCGTPGYVAPEILITDSRHGYTDKVDLFSVGVTLYVMLCGYEPFYGENEKDLIEANKKAVIEFSSNDWSSISDEACDIIRKLTEPDPKERLSAKDALKHPWIRSCVQ